MPEILDSYQRKIDYMRISVTDRCNLRCGYCMPEDGIPWKSRDEILSYEEILLVVRACVQLGINKFRMTGGEPLIRKDIVSLISQINSIPGVEDISLTSNGLLFTELAAELKSAGVRRVNFSLDTLQPERFQQITGSGSIDKVFAAVELADQLGFHPVKLNTVVIRGFNDDELPDLLHWVKDTPYILRFIEFMPNYGNLEKSWSMEKVIPSAEIQTICQSIFPMDPCDDVPGFGPARYFHIRGHRGIIGFISPLTDNQFCQSCRRIRLTADGKIHLCLHHQIEIDLQAAIRGHADVNAIAEIIQNGLAQKPKEHILREDSGMCFPGPMSQIGG